jgi:hypothetical protein
MIVKKKQNSVAIQNKFQVNFNALVKKQGITDENKLMDEAKRFFNYCVRNVSDGGHCPFPEYLVEGYLK